MQHNVELMLRPHHFAPDFDVIARGGLRAEVGANAPVNGDTPGRNQLVAMPPRANACRGEITI